MTPLQGLGGNTALRDAQLLFGHLVKAACEGRPLLPELTDYETTMRGYAFDAVRVSLRYTEQFVSENALARAAFKGVLRIADCAPILKKRWFSLATSAA
jgi:2-polyprenyl-6-methoxyphenol hydroxylase-like FAD-dependent oxidoreductase